MDATEAADDGIMELDSEKAEEFVLDSLDMILNNYRSIVESKGETFNICHLTDILRAFALYLYGTDIKRVSMMPPRVADLKLFDAVSERGVELEEGFHSWRSVSTVVQGMQMMSVPISASTLLTAFTAFSKKLCTNERMGPHLENILMLRDNVNDLVSDMVDSDEVLVPWFTLTTLSSLYGRSVLVTDNNGGDLKNLAMLLCGAKGIDRSKPLSPSPGGQTRDAILILPVRRGDEDLGVLEWVMDSLPEGDTLVLVTFPAFNISNETETRNARESLKKYRIECQYKIDRGQFFSTVPLFVTKIVKSEPRGSVRLLDQIDGLEGSVDQSEFDWNMDMLLHRDDYGKVPSVRLAEIADLRRGSIVPRSDMAEEHDPDRPVFVRPMDIVDGQIGERSNLLSIASDRYPLAQPGTILVSCRGDFGRTAIVFEKDSPCVASSNFSLISPGEEYSRDYLMAFFKSSYFLLQAKALSVGYLPNLTVQNLSEIRVPIATEEQQKAVSKSFKKKRNPDPEDVWKIFTDKLLLQIPHK